MAQLPYLISDLALILIVAGVTTVLFKWLRQPLVLGYIVAGMIAGPAVSLLPSVQDMSNIQTWADIGVLFLLFGLGLEFSFRKLLNVGKTGLITASVEVVSLLIVGYLAGLLMGWGSMNSLFLGGMLSMSSTTIIIKAFDDLNLRNKKFAGLVFGVLVVEDLVAIVLMVLLSTIAQSDSFSPGTLVTSVFKLVFFLSLWFICGIWIIPSLLSRTRRFMNDETLLVVCVGLCLCMVVLAVRMGFSSALGAFVMGSILAESVEVERIERLTKPLKDLFGAVFFVSVGMMVNLTVIVHYAIPIIIVTLLVLVFKLLATTGGMLLSGQSLKIAVQSGFSLAQIGEFAFIIAGLGLSLGVTDDFLYPVAVAVSVITTFLTPYTIRLAGPAYLWLERHLPASWKAFLTRFSRPSAGPSAYVQDWMGLLRNYTFSVLLMLMLSMGILLLSIRFVEPFLAERIVGERWAAYLTAFVTLLAMSPFLKSLVSNRTKTSGYMMNLWVESQTSHWIIRSLTALRIALAFGLIIYVLAHFLSWSVWLLLLCALAVLTLILRSKGLMRRYWQLESRFILNLNERQMEENDRLTASRRGVRNLDAVRESHWLDRSLYSFAMTVGPGSSLDGQALRDTPFRSRFRLMLVRVERNLQNGERLVECHNIPDSSFELRVGDRLTFAGRNMTMALLRDESLCLHFVPNSLVTLNQFSHQEESAGQGLTCAGIPVSETSAIAGLTLAQSHIGRKNKCLVVGLNRGELHYINPSSDFRLQAGDLVWVMGEADFVSRLISDNVYGL